MSGGYDQALLIQKLRAIASYSPLDIKRQYPVVTEDQVEQASWSVMWDLELAIQQQNPKAMDKAREQFRLDHLPGIIIALENEGFEII